MKTNRWEELEEILQTAKTKGASKEEFAEILSQQLSASEDTHDALETWYNYQELNKDQLVNEGAITWQEVFEIAADLAKDVEEAWDIFTMIDDPNDPHSLEAEAAFDKAMKHVSVSGRCHEQALCFGIMGSKDYAGKVVFQRICSCPRTTEESPG